MAVPGFLHSFLPPSNFDLGSFMLGLSAALCFSFFFRAKTFQISSKEPLSTEGRTVERSRAIHRIAAEASGGGKKQTAIDEADAECLKKTKNLEMRCSVLEKRLSSSRVGSTDLLHNETPHGRVTMSLGRKDTLDEKVRREHVLEQIFEEFTGSFPSCDTPNSPKSPNSPNSHLSGFSQHSPGSRTSPNLNAASSRNEQSKYKSASPVKAKDEKVEELEKVEKRDKEESRKNERKSAVKFCTGPDFIKRRSTSLMGSEITPDVVPNESEPSSELFKRPNLQKFHTFAGETWLEPQEIITFEMFAQICLRKLKLDLSRQELKRIFADMGGGKVGEGMEGMTFHQFTRSVARHAFMKHVVNSLTSCGVEFSVPECYDYSQPTSVNYCLPSLRFFGAYQEIRAEYIDYSYHVNYVQTRQLWQDQLIRTVVVRTVRQPHPWLVFTAGAMGAGKGFALSWMSGHGFFPLEHIVHIDPDHFRQQMPEWPGYVRRNPETAGAMTQLEVGIMQEIAAELALRNGQNIWIDGSLRDGGWVASCIEKLRLDYPQYKVAIFYVYASEATVRERCQKRAEATGRLVPEALITQSLDAPRDTLRKLVPLVDFVARIRNEGVRPVLEAVETIDRSGCWEEVKRRFARTTPSPNEFPNQLSPFILARVYLAPSEGGEKTTPSCSRCVIWGEEKDVKETVSDLASTLVWNANLVCSFNRWGEAGMAETSLPLVLSPPQMVNMDSETRKIAGIPSSAFTFVWAHPSSVGWGERREDEGEREVDGEGYVGVDSPAKRSSLSAETCCPLPPYLRDLLRFGGFLYFDVSQELVGVNSVSSATVTVHQGLELIQFARPRNLPEKAEKMIGGMGRWKPATLPFLVEKGVGEMAWVRAGESLGKSMTPSKYGGFAFRMKKGNGHLFFAVAAA